MVRVHPQMHDLFPLRIHRGYEVINTKDKTLHLKNVYMAKKEAVSDPVANRTALGNVMQRTQQMSSCREQRLVKSLKSVFTKQQAKQPL